MTRLSGWLCHWSNTTLCLNKIGEYSRVSCLHIIYTVCDTNCRIDLWNSLSLALRGPESQRNVKYSFYLGQENYISQFKTIFYRQNVNMYSMLPNLLSKLHVDLQIFKILLQNFVSVIKYSYKQNKFIKPRVWSACDEVKGGFGLGPVYEFICQVISTVVG